jgi:hypothetical protein
MVFYVVYKYAMELPESPKEKLNQMAEKVEEAVLDKVEEVAEKVEEVVPELADKVEDAVNQVDALASDAMNKLIERVPQAAKAVEIVDQALAGAACSCGLFGWTLSASRAPRSPAKPEDPSSEVPK